MFKSIITALVLVFTAATAQAEISHTEYLRTWDAVKAVGFKIYNLQSNNVMGYIDVQEGAIYINKHLGYKDSKETLMHEAVHLAQACKGNFKSYEPLLSHDDIKSAVSQKTKDWVIRNYAQEDHFIEAEAEGYALNEFTYVGGDLADIIYKHCFK